MTAITFQPTAKHKLRTGTIVSVVQLMEADPTKGYAWVRYGVNIYTMQARFDANGRVTMTAPDGTGWDNAGWTEAERRAA